MKIQFPFSRLVAKSLVLFLFVFAAAEMPVASAQSTDYDKELGEETAKQLEAQIGVFDNPNTQAYIEELGMRLVGELGAQPFDYTFQILDMDVPNALALPGGHIYVSRGLLALANSEDELAGVIGHEIIHVDKRHSIKAQRNAIFPALLQLPGAVVGIFAPGVGRVINAPFKATADLVTANYSRGHEKEADKLGIALAAKAGYVPDSLAIILDHLVKDIELRTGEEDKFGFFDSHPYTPKRVKKIGETSAKLTVADRPPIVRSREDLLSGLEGILIGENPAKGIFVDSLFLHPDLEIALLFPPKWKTANTAAAVGAFEPEGQAQLIMEIAGPAKDPEIYAREFFEQYKEQLPAPVRHEELTVNGNPAYLLTYEGEYSEGVLIVPVLWIRLGDLCYRLIGVGDKGQGEVMQQSMQSLRNITAPERASIKSTLLKIVSARKGETLSALSRRTGNVLQMDYTALINNIGAEALLSEGQLIKIGVEVDY